MVNSLVKTAGAFALAFFIAGLGWGAYSRQLQKAVLASRTPLRVLCADNWLSETRLKEFSKRHNVQIQLYTYTRPTEFLSQMANANGRIDVICTSSLILKSLVQNRWLAKQEFSDLANLQFVSVDFQHLPFDPQGEYSVPLFWNLYGFFGKGPALPATWKQTWTSKRVGFWGEELGLLSAMSRLGVNVEQRLEEEETKGLEEGIRKFTSGAAQILKPNLAPVTAESMIVKSDWILIPLGRVARLLGEESPYRFWLPEDGAAVEVGLLTIGSQAESPGLAKELIGELLSRDHAIEVHRRLGTGVVHSTLSLSDSVAPLQKAEALRKFPLNRFQFPDVNVEALPPFQKIYDESLKGK